MYSASTGHAMPAKAYVVAAPSRCDAIASTLRNVYAKTSDETGAFADIIAILDTIDLPKPRR